MIAVGLIMSGICCCLSCYGQMRLTEQDPKYPLMAGLQVVQNNAMRVILGKKKSDKISIKSLLEQCGWQSINRLTIKFILLQGWRTLTFNLNCEIVDDLTKEYARDTRATARKDFASDEKKYSTFVNNLARLLNCDKLSAVKACAEVKDVKKIVTDKLESFPL